MLKDNLLYYTYFNTGLLKLRAAQASLKINLKTEKSVLYKCIKKARKDINNTLIKAKKCEAKAVNYKFKVLRKLQTEC